MNINFIKAVGCCSCSFSQAHVVDYIQVFVSLLKHEIVN